MKVRIAGLSDTGRSRESNEDNLFISENEPLALVADGMGGHSSGEVASAYAVQTVRDFYGAKELDPDLEAELKSKMPPWPFKQRAPEHAEQRRLVQAVMLANEIIYSAATARPEFHGMGTTIVGGYFLETGLYLIHIGDSRAYRFRKGKLERITRDHSLADEYLQMGILTPEELDFFPYKNVITRALGLAETVEPDIRFWSIQPDDLYLFCSDGLTDPLTDEEIRVLLAANTQNLEVGCRQLIAAANEAGGPDNVTVILSKTYA